MLTSVTWLPWPSGLYETWVACSRHSPLPPLPYHHHPIVVINHHLQRLGLSVLIVRLDKLTRTPIWRLISLSSFFRLLVKTASEEFDWLSVVKYVQNNSVDKLNIFISCLISVHLVLFSLFFYGLPPISGISFQRIWSVGTVVQLKPRTQLPYKRKWYILLELSCIVFRWAVCVFTWHR
jgi:hypothetical protein